MTSYFVLRTTSGPVRFRVNEGARGDESVLVREEEAMIMIEREPPGMGPAEHCCFCDAPTRTWTVLPERKPGAQVACCGACAKTRSAEEVPDKRAWFETEQKKHARHTRWSAR